MKAVTENELEHLGERRLGLVGGKEEGGFSMEVEAFYMIFLEKG